MLSDEQMGLLILGVGALELLGAAALILGALTGAGSLLRLGSFLLVAFLLPVTFIVHWPVKDDGSLELVGENRDFWKNLAIAGALLLVMGGSRGGAVATRVKKD